MIAVREGAIDLSEQVLPRAGNGPRSWWASRAEAAPLQKSTQKAAHAALVANGAKANSPEHHAWIAAVVDVERKTGQWATRDDPAWRQSMGLGGIAQARIQMNEVRSKGAA
jgi:hypothetical protein